MVLLIFRNCFLYTLFFCFFFKSELVLCVKFLFSCFLNDFVHFLLNSHCLIIGILSIRFLLFFWNVGQLGIANL